VLAALLEGVAEQRRHSGVSTKPAAMTLTRTGASSSARLAASAGSPAVSRAVRLIPTAGRRAPVPLMNSSVPPGRTAVAACRAASRTSPTWSDRWRRASATFISASGA
jgi:hypothetical protein